MFCKRAQFDRRLQGEPGGGRQLAQGLQLGLAGPPFQVGQAAHPIDKPLAGNLGDGFKGNGELASLVEDQPGAGAQAVAQHAGGIGELRLGQQRLGASHHSRIQRSHHAAGHGAVGGGVHEDHGLPHPQSLGENRWHIHPGHELLVSDDLGEWRPRSDHIAHLGLHIAHGAADRRPQVAEAEISHAGHQVHAGGDVILPKLIPLNRAGRPLFHQIVVALEIEPFGFGFRPQPGHIRLGLSLIEHHQQLPLAHLIALAHEQALDPTTGLGRQLHLPQGLQSAHGVHHIGKAGHLDLLGLNRQGRSGLRIGSAAAGCQQGDGRHRAKQRGRQESVPGEPPGPEPLRGEPRKIASPQSLGAHGHRSIPTIASSRTDGRAREHQTPVMPLARSINDFPIWAQRTITGAG